ncbi:hypothetical protein AB0K20_23345 [Micromonospora matsumotoense]|uniref:hypothetical protein n=1 Tax=Micromonospora matsumotoense TaxID=121616 RepID=UPI00343C70EC
MPLIQSGMPLYPELLNSPTAWKTLDTARASTTTLAADPDLALPVIAGAVYVLSAYVAHTYDAACDFKFSWSGPSGATMTNWTADWRTTDGNEISGAFASLGSVVPITSGSGTLSQPLWAHGLLIIGGTAGTLALTWAQNTSSVNPATVRAGSTLRLERVA